MPTTADAPALDPALEALTEQARTLLEAGGPVMLILLGMSVFALTIVLLKLWQFARLRLGARRFVEQALDYWQTGQPREALAVLAGQRSPLAQVLNTAMQGSVQHGARIETVREEVLRQASAVLERLRGQLRGLELIASLSPLLGLLGTVLGMIGAFQRLESAGNQVDPSVLSGGIWEALLTTAAGLVVAIPAVIALNWLERRIERFSHRMEDAVTRVFTSSLYQPVPVVAAVSLRAHGNEHAT